MNSEETRVVVTGYGIISSLGNNRDKVYKNLWRNNSGIIHVPEYEERGMRSHVHGAIAVDAQSQIDRKIFRYMSDPAAWSYLAMVEAMEHAGLSRGFVDGNPRIGLIVGTGGASPASIVDRFDAFREKGIRRVGAYGVTKTMASTITACLGTPFGIQGAAYGISSACATSAHCIGHGAELIQLGKQDLVFAGGGEELSIEMSILFDGMSALSSGYNDRPTEASRPFDALRDGFVISGGAGIVVLESLAHAKARGATIIAELLGYGSGSDGFDMTNPSGVGAERCMQQAIATLPTGRKVGYINAHGTSTPAGDMPELGAVKNVFGKDVPPISSTKSISGHALGAAGVNESIYSLIAMDNNFLPGTVNLTNPDPKIPEGLDIVTTPRTCHGLDVVMSNSFGFGGVNASLVFGRWTQ